LTEEEREILNPLFGKKDVPHVLRGKDWLSIEEAFFHQTHELRGTELFVKAGKGRELFMKIQRHVHQLTKQEIPPPKEDSSGALSADVEEDLPPSISYLNWSRTIDSRKTKGKLTGGKMISLSDYQEDLELQAVYRNLKDSFPSTRDVGKFLLDTMMNSDPWIRERHVQVYELHIKSLLRMNSPRFSPWIIEEIQKGMIAIEALKKDPVLNVKSTAAVVYRRLQDFIPKYLPTLLQKN
jgi:hypothetical protein